MNTLRYLIICVSALIALAGPPPAFAQSGKPFRVV